MKDILSFNWQTIYHTLNEKGFAKISNVLSQPECLHIRELYNNEHLYRSTISMQRYRFGKGEYKYFNYPLPAVVQSLRENLYTPLATLANQWMNTLAISVQYPETHQRLITICQQQNQIRPTPLILNYEAGGYNTLHQDLYGTVYFPFQVVLLLSEPNKEFEGGEFVITEQIPRAQSRAHVVPLNLGDALIFTTNFKPAKSSRGFYRANMKHGISEVTSGVRFALGIIFHDAT